MNSDKADELKEFERALNELSRERRAKAFILQQTKQQNDIIKAQTDALYWYKQDHRSNSNQ